MRKRLGRSAAPHCGRVGLRRQLRLHRRLEAGGGHRPRPRHRGVRRVPPLGQPDVHVERPHRAPDARQRVGALRRWLRLRDVHLTDRDRATAARRPRRRVLRELRGRRSCAAARQVHRRVLEVAGVIKVGAGINPEARRVLDVPLNVAQRPSIGRSTPPRGWKNVSSPHSRKATSSSWTICRATRDRGSSN